MRRGAVLLFALIVMSITIIVTGGLCSYYVGSMRVAKFYNDQRSSRRVGAARALRTSLDSIMEKLEAMANETQGSVGSAVALNMVRGKEISEVLAELKKAVPESMTIDGEVFTLEAETDEKNKTLRIHAYSGGIKVASTTVELEEDPATDTLGVFDYVYFADNNGQLTSDYIIANGEVGSNGDFDLRGATVNGFVRYLNTMRLSGSPHAWLQGAYMAKIAAEFEVSSTEKTTIEQARPTNPALYVENSETKSIEWTGGYEPVHASNPYSWDEKPPEAVAPAGDPPTKPSEDDIWSTTTKPKGT